MKKSICHLLKLRTFQNQAARMYPMNFCYNFIIFYSIVEIVFSI